MSHARVFFRWCVRLNILQRDPTSGIRNIPTVASKVILTLEDTDHLLDICRQHFPEILPAVSLQLFTGIRTSEVCRLDWDQVKHGRLVDISDEVSKTGERRVIDWWPPRLTSLIPMVVEGAVIERLRKKKKAGGSHIYEKAKGELVAKCIETKPTFKWGQNAMRHSFATYAVAHFQDAGKVALLMGHHDSHLLFKHYRAYCTKLEGDQYFGFEGREDDIIAKMRELLDEK